MASKSVKLGMKDILNLASSTASWSKFEDKSHAFVELYFRPSSAPAAFGQKNLPKGCIDHNVSGKDAESMKYNGAIVPDTSIFFGGTSLLSQPGKKVNHTNALLCLEYTNEVNLTKYVTTQNKMDHAHTLGTTMKRRKLGSGRSSGELIHKAWESKSDVPDLSKPEVPVVLIIAASQKDRSKLPEAAELQADLQKTYSGSTVTATAKDHKGGYEIADSSGDPVAYLGIITKPEWVDMCTTMLALSGLPSTRLIEAMDRIIWEMTSNALGTNSAYKLASCSVLDNPWKPSDYQSKRGSDITFQGGAVLGVHAFFGINKKDLVHQCTVPRTAANPDSLQRPLDENHLISMANSISQKKQLPGILTLYFDGKIDVIKKGKKDEVVLEFPLTKTDTFSPYSIEVLDGQHRLFSHYWSDSDEEVCDVLLYFRIEGTEEEISDAKAELFYDINYKAKEPDKLLALFHATKFDDLSSYGWVTKTGKSRSKTASYDSKTHTAAVHAYKFLLELGNHYPFKGLFEDHGLGKSIFPLSTIAGYISAHFDFGIDKSGNMGDYSIHKIANNFPNAKAKTPPVGIAKDGWCGVSPVYLGMYKSKSGWYGRAAKNFISFCKQIEFDQWWDKTAPVNISDWLKERKITNTQYKSDAWGVYLRHQLESAPKTSLLSTLLFLWIVRTCNPDKSTVASKLWTNKNTEMSDSSLTKSRNAMREVIQDPEILRSYTGYKAVDYPCTEAMKGWNKHCPKEEKYKLKQFKWKDHGAKIRAIIPTTPR